MKKNKKILMIGTAITSIAAPVATVISCGSDDNGGNPDTVFNGVLNKGNYKQHTSYDETTKTLTIKGGVKEITNVFQNGYIDPDTQKTKDIAKLILPATLEKIDDNAFENAHLKTLFLPNRVASIGRNAFINSPLTYLVIQKSIKSIDDVGESAFAGIVKDLNTTVTMPLGFNNTAGKKKFFGTENPNITILDGIYNGTTYMHYSV